MIRGRIVQGRDQHFENVEAHADDDRLIRNIPFERVGAPGIAPPNYNYLYLPPARMPLFRLTNIFTSSRPTASPITTAPIVAIKFNRPQPVSGRYV